QLGQAVAADLQVAAVEGSAEHTLSAVYDRDDHLAGDVPAHDQGVAAVELAGVEELAQAYLRAVDVGGEVDLPVSHVGSLPLPRGARTRVRGARSGRAPSSAATWTARRWPAGWHGPARRPRCGPALPARPARTRPVWPGCR